jgi:hypothetical protein
MSLAERVRIRTAKLVARAARKQMREAVQMARYYIRHRDYGRAIEALSRANGQRATPPRRKS